MKITRIECVPLEIPIPSWRSGYVVMGFESAAEKDLIVKIHTDENITGYGEAMFSPPYHGETQESSIGAIKLLTSTIVGRDPFDIEQIEADMDEVIEGNVFAKAAVDFALHDIIGKKLKMPLYAILGGKCRDNLAISQVIGWADSAANAKEARTYVDQGFSTIKIKVGMKPMEKDIDRVRAIREEVGPEIQLRVDANQCWHQSEAIKILRKMAKYDLEYVEQPVPYWDLDGMARVRKEVGIPVTADESLFSCHDALKLVKNQAADVFNIKVVKGGLREAKKIASVAEAAGLSCVVGAMVELGLGTAAGIHFAVSTKNVDYACECCGAIFFDADIIRETILPKKGCVVPPEGYGLGVELDEAKVDSMRVAPESDYKIQFKKFR